MKVVMRKISDLTPSPNNSRTHSPEQIAQISESISTFGFTNPVLISSEDFVICGHGRILGAEELGQEEVPTITLDNLSETEIKAYMIADNQLALNAGWDFNLLSVEIESLISLDFDIDLLGFSDDFIQSVLGDTYTGLTGPDAIPPVPEHIVSKPGDVWVLGDHRLMCGDSTAQGDIDKLMDGQLADLCFTSPPYLQQRDYKQPISDWDSLMNGVYSILPVKEGAQVLVNLGLIHKKGEWLNYWDNWLEHMREIGWRRFGMYVWDQGSGIMGNHHGRLAPSFELIFHFCRDSPTIRKTVKTKDAGKISGTQGQRGKDGKSKRYTHAGRPIQATKVRDSVIRVNRALTGHDGHPAAFPVELCRELSIPWCKRGDICFDPFSGSGTQMINCEKEGFYLYGMELAPEYVDISIQRWQQFTGREAFRDGVSYSQISENSIKITEIPGTSA